MVKPLTKIIGLKIEEFDKHLNPENKEYKTISSQEVVLIPVDNPGKEQALTTVFLAGLRLIKEFRRKILRAIKLNGTETIFVYREVVFENEIDNSNSRIDGLLIYVSSGIIKDAVIFEMKNDNDIFDEIQITKYINIAKKYKLNKIVTVSNQFVTSPTQTPIKGFKIRKSPPILFHLSWSYILTEAKMLLFKDIKKRIGDDDQIEIMNEIVKYFEHKKSGIIDFKNMGAGWKSVVERSKQTNKKLKEQNNDVTEVIINWLQEEKDIALKLSRDIGILVTLRSSTIKENKQRLCDKKILMSYLKIKDAVSDFEILLNLSSNNVELSVLVDTKPDDSNSIKIKDIVKQIEKCKRKNKDKFNEINKGLKIEPQIKHKKERESYTYDEFVEKSVKKLKGKEINKFRIIHHKELRFTEPAKFIIHLEAMISTFYEIIVAPLQNPKKKAPQPQKKTTLESTDPMMQERSKEEI